VSRAAACARRRGGNAGFALLEMLVAVAILAVLVSVIPRSFVFARTVIHRSEAWTEARLVAEVVLNGELAAGDLQPGTRRGDVDGRAWVATIQRNAELSAGVQSNRALLQVNLQVDVLGEDRLTVETLRIGAAQ
jgi:prepilin-type N-terminal cleavage/methylation domain-containing protein